jgi:hypothetical protein
MNTDKLLKVLIVAGVAALAIVSVIGCSSPTGPSPVPETTTVPLPAEQVETPAVVTPDPTGHTDVNIGRTGTVNISSDETYTACLYDATVNHNQPLLLQYRVKPGKTVLPYTNDTCFPETLQVDVIVGDCPNPAQAFDDYRGGLRFTLPAGKTGPECEECVEEEPTLVKTEVIEGEWNRNPRASSTTEICFEYRTITTIHTWQLCDTVWTTTETEQEQRPVDCDDACDSIPTEGTTLTWTGAGDPQTECRAFGSFNATEGRADFFICKAGNDRIVDYPPLSVGTCDNGKDISHFTACVCVDE